ncbi:uncharacterized protein [Rhodnius prolixus]|uniref:uncharacterized protein n=1 Tax=Rhodnius prolixus TaxID=13249 RepID=UPI003D18A557
MKDPVDLIVNEVSNKVRNTEEVSGGLRAKLKLPWNYPPLFENNILVEENLNKRCLGMVYTCSDMSEVGAARRHGQLLIKKAVTYFPATTAKLKLPSKLGTHLWKLHCGNLKPDEKFLKLLEEGLFDTLPKLLSCAEQMDTLILNECLINFNWLSQLIKQETFETVALFLKGQSNLSSVILENAMLNAQDGLRFLYIFGYRCGNQIEYLNMAYFFKYGIHPIKGEDNEYSVKDSFIFSEKHETIRSEEEQKYFWSHAIMKANYVIPEQDYSILYRICLNLFSSLKSLHIQYSYLCQKQGRKLCQIASILNGRLEELYLLCTPKDLPKVTNQVITKETWFVATSLCPKLNVHLIFSCIPYYDYIKTIVFPTIPLVSFYMDSSISHVEIEHLNCWYFGCTIKMLITYFCYRIRRLNLHIWHSNEKVDVTICKCITNLYHLEKFEYRGPFDTLDTVNELCSFIVTNNLRLNVFHVYVLEDACNPKLYQEAVSKLYEEFKGRFIAKDINFLLSTTCI